MTHLLDHLLAAYGYWAVVLMVGLESLGIPMPGETALITASIYAGATHNLSILLVVLAAISGAIAGDNVGFAIGHWGGYRLLVRYGKYVRLNEARIKLGRYVFLRHGGKVVFFGRFVSVLRTYAALLAGTNRMPWWRFLGFNAAGGTIWACLYGLGAYFLGAQLVRLTGPATMAAGITAAVVIVAFFVFVRRNENRLEAAAERALPGPLDWSDRDLPMPPGRGG